MYCVSQQTPVPPFPPRTQSDIHTRNNRVLQLVNEAAARDAMRNSWVELKKVGGGWVWWWWCPEYWF